MGHDEFGYSLASRRPANTAIRQKVRPTIPTNSKDCSPPSDGVFDLSQNVIAGRPVEFRRRGPLSLSACAGAASVWTPPCSKYLAPGGPYWPTVRRPEHFH